MKNKKVIGITIAALLILVMAVVATSYAMFSANFTGTKENVLSTGYVTMNCNQTTFTLNDTNTLTDAQGIALNNNEATCTLTTTMNGTMTLGYDVALTDVDADTPSDGLGSSSIKIRALKEKGGTAEYLAGSTATTGVLISSLQNQAGQYDTSITNYNIDSATTSVSEEVTYRVKAWVSGEVSGQVTNTNTDGLCSDTTKTTEAECKAAGGIWGYDQKTEESGGSFSFKLKVGASQILN